MKIAWSVKIPDGAKLKIKENDSVTVGDVIYEYNQNVVERLPLVGWQSLGSNDRKNILQNIIKKDVVLGEIIGKIGWFSKNIIKSPGTGKCLGVDEFGNMELEKKVEEIYKSPISAKKVRVEVNSLVFEFKGEEFEAEGLNQLKAWGDFNGLIVDDPSQIDSEQLNQIVVVKSSLEAAIKAEAVGATGLILVDFEKTKEFDDSDIPIVLMSEDDVMKLKKISDNKEVEIWINAPAGIVLMMLE